MKTFFIFYFFIFFLRSPEKIFEDLFFFWRALALVSLVLGLGLEHSCPWPRECLSSERLSLALASNFFVSLALASSLVSSTPPLLTKLRSENVWKLRTAIINRPLRLQLIISHKKRAPFFTSIKPVLMCNKCYPCKLVCAGTMNEWCKILTIKTLTEVNRT